MPKTTKKILCYTAITSILNLSFQPAYAGKSDLPFNSEEMSYTQKVSHHLTKKGLHKERMSDHGLEDTQTNFTKMPQTAEADVVDVASWFVLTPLKTMIGAVSLVKQGVKFALENPGQAITMGLLLQAKTVTSTLSLSSLTAAQGFTISGAVAGDQSGYPVSSAGDFNGDGLNDIIIGAYRANSYAGKSYVIYGTNSTPSSLSLSSLTPLQGFTISGAVANDASGLSVSSAGDFNGDGLNDIIIGAYRANSYAGKSYVIYGTNSTPSSLSLSSLTPLQGFTINGAAANDASGYFVSSAGDFNGDGLNDIIIGAPQANSFAGKSYIIYGTKSTPSSISLGSLTAAQGLTISGAVAGDQSGHSVSSARNFNSDGLGDIIIGAYAANSGAGKSYVIYGTNSSLSSISLSSLTPLQGFTITGAAAGDYSGGSVSSAGDFNGDGLSDIIIGAANANNNVGNSYLIYGTNSSLSSISLSSLTPLQGFTITGAAAGDYSGGSVSSAGDFNGDGRNDVIIGAYGANSYAGKSYVIYGTNSTLSSLNLSSLTPLQGFTITGTAANDVSGGSVSSAGDFNGDGRNDVIIGAYGANNGTGNSYVIYGAPKPAPLSAPAPVPLPAPEPVPAPTITPTPSVQFSSGTGSLETLASSTRVSTPSSNPLSSLPTQSSSNTGSLGTSDPSIGVVTSSISPPPSPTVLFDSSSSSIDLLTNSPSGKTAAIIGGAVGGVAFLAVVVGGIMIKVCCFSGVNKSDKSTGSDEERAEENNKSSPPANVDNDDPMTLTNIAKNRSRGDVYLDFGNLPKKGKHKEQIFGVDNE